MNGDTVSRCPLQVVCRDFINLKIKINNDPSENEHENDSVKLISVKLSKQRNQTITRDELDVILGISHLSYESIKSTRSRMINSINE